jgi:hypothetical protein
MKVIFVKEITIRCYVRNYYKGDKVLPELNPDVVSVTAAPTLEFAKLQYTLKTLRAAGTTNEHGYCWRTLLRCKTLDDIAQPRGSTL